ncbi:uncharacterized protein PHACADRAFT_201703 [Phanerochaete carnosa HHB-10118-sp]|uniref:Uncharacterized protein n=1 Tax=Phanerochaete carnosa (strain HHB-10118-sp) TaxID=650164 RepID=K5VRR0_PHACS|nr:uncharacterized protein PHACADRAFT_201703 [Phanerochaete carnosa HHB-10118-sp]EKM49445.1 hypothetical protein PHACADRAFT_201703 [Phanerochaete carnosa HHB-10118-sp]
MYLAEDQLDLIEKEKVTPPQSPDCPRRRSDDRLQASPFPIGASSLSQGANSKAAGPARLSTSLSLKSRPQPVKSPRNGHPAADGSLEPSASVFDNTELALHTDWLFFLPWNILVSASFQLLKSPTSSTSKAALQSTVHLQVVDSLSSTTTRLRASLPRTSPKLASVFNDSQPPRPTMEASTPRNPVSVAILRLLIIATPPPNDLPKAAW